MAGTCESCGSPDEEIVRVVRLYVVHSPDEDRQSPEGADAPPAATTEADEELWCFSCRTHYAHRVLG